MKILLIGIVQLLLLLAGPILGYQLAMRQLKRTRWKVVLWSGAGGAVAGDLFVGVLLIADSLADGPARALLRLTLAVVGVFTAFGLLLALAGLVPRAAKMPRLILTGLTMVGLWTLVPAAVNAATHGPPPPGASGVVLGPDGRPVAGAPVFLDRGSGRVERLTTDRAGLFRAARGRIGSPQLLLLICVPGAVPFVGKPDEHILTPEQYQVAALPPRAIVTPGILSLGWRAPIPHECLVGSLEQ